MFLGWAYNIGLGEKVNQLREKWLLKVIVSDIALIKVVEFNYEVCERLKSKWEIWYEGNGKGVFAYSLDLIRLELLIVRNAKREKSFKSHLPSAFLLFWLKQQLLKCC